MRYSKEKVEDFDLAWKMAIAENPYRELATLATKHGLTDIVKTMTNHARHASYEVEKAYKEEARILKYKEIKAASETPLLTVADFIDVSGNTASRVWHLLRHTVEEDPSLPIEFVQFAEDEYVLRGDFGAAAEALGGITRASIILGTIAQNLADEQQQL